MTLFKPLFVLLFLHILTTQAFAADCVAWQPVDAPGHDLIVGSIMVNNADVFNLASQKESRLFHRIANKLHYKTRVSTIRSQLLFKTGDAFDLRILNETERLLRANRYIKDASVKPLERCGKRVNIAVNTRDNWTLTPGVSFGSSGGKNKSGVEIQEHNLFGLGKSLSINYKNGVERTSSLISYSDPQLLGTRKRLDLSFQDNSDGQGYLFDLNLPFYALDSSKSWGVKTSKLKQQVPIYNSGLTRNKVGEERNIYSLYYGWLGKRRMQKGVNSVSRFKVGWQFDQLNYFKTPSSDSTGKITQSYPWLEYQYFEDNYIKKTNFKTMGHIEDISLGTQLTAGLGLLHKSFGSDDNYLKFSGKISRSLELDSHHLTSFYLKGTSYLGDGVLQGENISLGGEWNAFNATGNHLNISARVTSASNLLKSEQTLLGGENGLRGYPFAYQTGNKSALLSLEKRYHFDWYPFDIAKFGMVAFTDIGTAWGAGNDASILADAGIGLRIVPTRSSSAKTIHIDFAIPLTQRDKVDDYQFVIETKQYF